MSHSYPVIEHINDVLPAIAGRTDFIVVDKGDYKIVDYVYTLTDSFDDPLRLELRGLKFGKDGLILARPLHKFFNNGERPETIQAALDFSQPHDILEKLDGSMVHTATLNGDLVLMTRMGRTDVALAAEQVITPDLRQRLMPDVVDGLYTHIFEYTAPTNRIVIKYDKPELTLIAVRSMTFGDYMPYNGLEEEARFLGVPVVRRHDFEGITVPAFIQFVKELKGMEGFVVRWHDKWVKLKAEDYTLKHRAKEVLGREKDLTELILKGEYDDLRSLLSPEDQADADAFRDEFLKLIDDIINNVQDRLASCTRKGYSRKEIAQDIDMRNFSKIERSLTFGMLDGYEPRAFLTELFIKRKPDELHNMFVYPRYLEKVKSDNGI